MREKLKWLFWTLLRLPVEAADKVLRFVFRIHD